LPAEEIEHVRWKAERWMKVRHMPAALRHDPWFVLRHAPEMLAHTFRGCTLRSVLGLETKERRLSATNPSGAVSVPREELLRDADTVEPAKGLHGLAVIPDEKLAQGLREDRRT